MPYNPQGMMLLPATSTQLTNTAGTQLSLPLGTVNCLPTDYGFYPQHADVMRALTLPHPPGVELNAVCACCGKRELIHEPKLPAGWLTVNLVSPIVIQRALCSFDCMAQHAEELKAEAAARIVVKTTSK